MSDSVEYMKNQARLALEKGDKQSSAVLTLCAGFLETVEEADSLRTQLADATRKLEEASSGTLFVLTYPTGAKASTRRSPDSFELRECDIKTAKEMQRCGFMYIDDNGHGPFYIDSEEYANRYLHSWPVFKIAPSDGHVCDYEHAYGKCGQCAAIDQES
jgi:hypothetical protein